MGTLVAPRLIEGEGSSAITWQRWWATTPCDELPPAGGLSPHQRLVVVAPHPDDEVLACGALIAMHAARGGEVVVIAVTDGEASHAEAASGWSTHDLATERRAERQRGMARLGIERPEVHLLALEDGRVQAQGGVLRGALSFLLRPRDVVVSTWEGDGHPDHNATGLAARQVCQNVGCRFLAAPVWMWHWSATGDPRVPWTRLRRLTLSDDAWARKQAALAEHVTQLTPRSDSDGAVLGAGVLARAAWRFEYYFI